MSAARSSWTAILLAGQRPEGDPLADRYGTSCKALIPIGGLSMLARVTKTLLSSPFVSRVVILAQHPGRLVTGDTSQFRDDPRIHLVESGPGIASSIAEVAGSAVAPWPVLVTTADHALLTESMIESFWEGANQHDIAIAVGERRVVEARFPMTRRTWLKFSDGHFSGANLFHLGSPKVAGALSLWSGVEQRRKTAWRMFTPSGPWLLLRALTRSITFREAIRQTGKRLGADAGLVVLPQPEAVIDVDKLSDLELVETILENRAGA